MVPSIALAAVATAIAASGLDLRFADLLYRAEGQQWALRSAFLTEHVLHVGGRWASAVACMAVLAGLAATWLHPAAWRDWRRPLACLAASLMFATALVAWIKTWSGADCPWDLVRYGGERAYAGWLAPRPEGQPPGACFPAGHASGGYAWMAGYFLCVAKCPAWRRRVLVMAIVSGLAFGAAQQLRGAHFLSHDLWTAALCWLVAVAVHAATGQPLRPAGATEGSATA